MGTRNLGEILSQRDSIAMEMQVIMIMIMITITITSIINVINIIINVENKSIKSSIFTENCLFMIYLHPTAENFQRTLDIATEPWGVKVERVEVMFIFIIFFMFIIIIICS